GVADRVCLSLIPTVRVAVSLLIIGIVGVGGRIPAVMPKKILIEIHCHTCYSGSWLRHIAAPTVSTGIDVAHPKRNRTELWFQLKANYSMILHISEIAKTAAHYIRFLIPRLFAYGFLQNILRSTIGYSYWLCICFSTLDISQFCGSSIGNFSFIMAIKPILILLHQETEIAKTTAHYIRFLIPGLFAYGFLQNILRFLQTQSILWPLVTFTGLPLVIYTGFAYALVHWTSLSFVGAPLATSVSLWLSVLMLAICSLYKVSHSWIICIWLPAKHLEVSLDTIYFVAPGHIHRSTIGYSYWLCICFSTLDISQFCGSSIGNFSFIMAIKPILILLHQETEIAKTAAHYIRFLIPGLFAYGFLQNILRFLQTQSILWPLVIFTGLPLVIHTGFAYALVHWTSLSFVGALLATSVSLWLSVLMLAMYVSHSWIICIWLPAKHLEVSLDTIYFVAPGHIHRSTIGYSYWLCICFSTLDISQFCGSSIGNFSFIMAISPYVGHVCDLYKEI
ncbi:protein detoxification 18, partial [Quercus suber]